MTLLARSEFHREPAAVPAARAFVAHSLTPLRLGPELVDRLVLAAAEACNNAVQHAGGDTFAVAVAHNRVSCSISVIDAGGGFATGHRPLMPPAFTTRHRGLALMHALVDDVRIESSPAGTSIVLQQRILVAGTVRTDGIAAAG